MVTLNNFNANEVDPKSDFEPIPAGKYLAIISESQMKATKAGDGAYLEFTFQVVEGEHIARKLWARLNLDNPSAKAVEIARAELSSICRACGVMTPRDSSELHNIPITIGVAQKTGTDGVVRNVIRSYAKKEAAAGQPQQATGPLPPWKRQ